MAFIERSLSKGEQLEARFHLHWVNYLAVALTLAAALAPWCLLSLDVAPSFLTHDKTVRLGVAALSGCLTLKAVWGWLALNKIELGVTNKRIIKKTGVLTRSTDEMKIGSIETITLRQGVIGSLLNYGNLLVTGKGVSDVAFINISKPLMDKRTVESIDLPSNTPA